MQEELLNHLIALQSGCRLVLRWRRNQYGEDVPVKSLFFKRGGWKVREVVCSSSLAYGLGDCPCQDHSPAAVSKVSQKKALELIQEYLEEKKAEERERNEEAAGLADLLRQPS